MDKERLMKMKKEDLIDIVMENISEKHRTPSDVIKKIREIKIDYNKENFILLCYDAKMAVIKSKILFIGGIDKATVDLKVVFNEILTTKRTTSFIVAHNHPSGSLIPSSQDILITEKIKKSAEFLTLNFLDHIIFTRSGFERIEI